MPMAKPVSAVNHSGIRRGCVTCVTRRRLLVVLSEGVLHLSTFEYWGRCSQSICESEGTRESDFFEPCVNWPVPSGRAVSSCFLVVSLISFRVSNSERKPNVGSPNTSLHGLSVGRICINASSYLVDPASSHMLVSKIKPCMSKYKQIHTVKLRMAH